MSTTSLFHKNIHRHSFLSNIIVLQKPISHKQSMNLSLTFNLLYYIYILYSTEKRNNNLFMKIILSTSAQHCISISTDIPADINSTKKYIMHSDLKFHFSYLSWEF